MSEQVIQFPQRHNPEQDAALTGLEVADDLLQAQERLTEALGEYTEAEISLQTGERLNLQERYQTSYDPEVTIPEVGRRAMASVINFPQLDQTLAANTMQVVDKGAEVIDLDVYRDSKEDSATKTIYRENGLAYAQDQPELMGYAGQARAIIHALMSGDESQLGMLPPRFQEALSMRMASHDGDISTDEYEAMISVACNGLAEANGRLELNQAA